MYHMQRVAVRDTFCSYGVMELCTRGLGTSISTLRSRGVNLSSVRILCVIAEERPRIQLTQSFSKLFSALGLSPRVVSTSFGCRVDTGICLQVCGVDTGLCLQVCLVDTGICLPVCRVDTGICLQVCGVDSGICLQVCTPVSTAVVWHICSCQLMCHMFEFT